MTTNKPNGGVKPHIHGDAKDPSPRVASGGCDATFGPDLGLNTNCGRDWQRRGNVLKKRGDIHELADRITPCSDVG